MEQAKRESRDSVLSTGQEPLKDVNDSFDQGPGSFALRNIRSGVWHLSARDNEHLVGG